MIRVVLMKFEPEAPSNWWTPLLSSGGSGKVSNGQGRRHFTDEFKREAVALLVSSGRPLSRIASELGLSPLDAAQLAQWKRRAGCGVGAAHDTGVGYITPQQGEAEAA
jgi:transposase-like protein